MSVPNISIIVPVKNGWPFIIHAIQSVLDLGDVGIEVVVSDNGSEDGGKDWLAALRTSQIRYIHAPGAMSMADHWELASTHARGQWQMFLGQDDGLLPNFWTLAQELISRAESKSLRVIVARRAFFNWPGLEPNAPKFSTELSSSTSTEIRSSSLGSRLALASLRSYHSLPQMYTTCLVQQSLVREIRNCQKGRLIVAHPQDASLAASVTSLEKSFLWSGTPFSWVGTSPKSAGKAVLDRARRQVSVPARELAARYESSVMGSANPYPAWAGPFNLGDNAVYFWQARQVVGAVSGVAPKSDGSLPLFLVLVLGFMRSVPGTPEQSNRIEAIADIARRNGLPPALTVTAGILVSIFAWLPLRVVRGFRGIFLRPRTKPASPGMVFRYGQLDSIGEANRVFAKSFG